MVNGKEGVLGPPPLQIIPTGLLGFLGLKNGGKYPQNLGSDFLQTTMEMLEWYASANSENLQTAQVAIPGTGNVTTNLVVPQTQLWMVLDYTIHLEVAAAANIARVYPAYTAAGVGELFKIGESAYVNEAGVGQPAAVRGAARMIRQPLFLLPNQSLGMVVEALTGAPLFRCMARIARLPI